MSLLEGISGPSDLRSLSRVELDRLADEIRGFLVSNVSRTGGHLGPNLGVVELTLAIHRVFDSPDDPIVFDTGHQSYVHKVVTGRQNDFPTLRQRDGLSGYPSRSESEHDWVENSHASTALSWAAGLAQGFRLRGDKRTAVAVVGDGSLTGGMAWEAINNIAADKTLPIVIVINDNGRSYTPTVGGLANQLQGLRTDRRYEAALGLVKRNVPRTPVIGKRLYALLHAIKTGIKDWLAPQGIFSDLGLKYVGPIDGHDIDALEGALQAAKYFGGPVLVHAITRKGKGFPAAENNEEDRFHAVGRINELTGEPLSAQVASTWTDVFAEEMVKLGAANPSVVGITAAMLHPVGLAPFKASFPSRTFDVGIAEQHAVTFAAGLARTGLHPVVAVYSTFLNRAFDQVLLDVALHDLGVTFVLDRAGITGPDGPSHHGMWDMAILSIVPGMRLAAPRDATRLREALTTAVADNHPRVIRFSKDAVPADIKALRKVGTVDVLAQTPDPRVLVVAIGQFAGLGVEVSARLTEQGIGSTVVDPVWALPADDDVVRLAAQHDLVITIEDGLVGHGAGAALELAMEARGVGTPIRQFGVPHTFIPQGSREEILRDLGLTSGDVARTAVELLLAGEPVKVAQETPLG